MDQLKYLLLTNTDLSITIDCVVKVFLYDEPMTKNLDITESEFKNFVTIICNKCVKEKLSYICKNSHNKIIGFCLNEDLIDDGDISLDKITPKMNPILNLLGSLDSSYLKNKRKTKNTFFHLFMVGSLSEYRNQGIVKRLIKNSLVLAKKNKYKTALSEATNLKSQNLLEKFNFKFVKKVKYSDFKFKGVYFFKNIGEKYCKLMELKIL